MIRRKTLVGVVITFSLIMVSESVLARGGHGGGGRSGGHSGGHSARSGGHSAAPSAAPRVSGGYRYSGPRVVPRFIVRAPAVWYYPPVPPLYYPLAIAAPAALPFYIELGAGAAQPGVEPSQGNWYYCADTQAYYPYVNECPGGWQPVAPSPSDSQ